MRIYRMTRDSKDYGIGTSWTDDVEAALTYDGTILLIAELPCEPVVVPGYDTATGVTPADSRECRDEWSSSGARVVSYADEDLRERPMTTYRMVGAGVVHKVRTFSVAVGEDYSDVVISEYNGLAWVYDCTLTGCTIDKLAKFVSVKGCVFRRCVFRRVMFGKGHVDVESCLFEDCIFDDCIGMHNIPRGCIRKTAPSACAASPFVSSTPAIPDDFSGEWAPGVWFLKSGSPELHARDAQHRREEEERKADWRKSVGYPDPATASAVAKWEEKDAAYQGELAALASTLADPTFGDPGTIWDPVAANRYLREHQVIDRKYGREPIRIEYAPHPSPVWRTARN